MSCFVYYHSLFLTIRPLLETSLLVHWLIPVIQGSIGQDEIQLGKRRFVITIIARRSRYHAGPRYFKRGINEQGRVANEVECEQVLWEISPIKIPLTSATASLHGSDNDSKNDISIMGMGSFVMVRSVSSLNTKYP